MARGDTEAVATTQRRQRAQIEARRQRKGERAARGERPRIEEAETVDEALDAEYERGRAEGAKSSPRAAQPAPAPEPATSSRTFSAPSGTVPTLAGPLAVETVLIAVDELRTNHRLPIPSRLLAAFGLFTVLGFARGEAGRAANALGWGIVVATFYASVAKSTPLGLGAVKTVGDFMAGKYATPNAAGTPAGAGASTVGPSETTAGSSTGGGPGAGGGEGGAGGNGGGAIGFKL